TSNLIYDHPRPIYFADDDATNWRPISRAFYRLGSRTFNSPSSDWEFPPDYEPAQNGQRLEPGLDIIADRNCVYRPVSRNPGGRDLARPPVCFSRQDQRLE